MDNALRLNFDNSVMTDLRAAALSVRAPAPARPVAKPTLRRGVRVLHIGDSHTAGTYGQSIDRLMRRTGATVETYGSAGSSAWWWVKGYPTQYGFVGRKRDGSVESVTRRATPTLSSLLRRNRPHVVVISLGANFRGNSAAGIRNEVRSLAALAKRSGAKVIWVGPPRTRADAQNGASLKAFNDVMRAAMKPYGLFIGSAGYTSSYSGSDGIHFNGARGTRIAQHWAKAVFNRIQRGK